MGFIKASTRPTVDKGSKDQNEYKPLLYFRGQCQPFLRLGEYGMSYQQSHT